MTNDDAHSKRPGEESRGAAHEARQRWAHEVIQALAERRLSINAAARELCGPLADRGPSIGARQR